MKGCAPAAVLLDQRERRARHLVGRRAEPERQAAHEGGLAGTELTGQEDDVPRPEGGREPFAGSRRFAFSLGIDRLDRHVSDREPVSMGARVRSKSFTRRRGGTEER